MPEPDRRGALAELLAAQALSGPPLPDPPAVAERLLAIQAQDLRGAQLAVRARTKGASVLDVDRALTEDRSLLVSWLNRGTLHLVRREDHAWLQALTTPQLRTSNARRLEQEGVAPAQAERGADLIERALEQEGPLPREALRARLDAAGVPTAGQALVHILLRTSLRGTIVRGPMVGTQQAFVLTRDWLGPTPPVDRDAALAELAHRYLAGHGPASDRDLARWAGIGLRDARAGLTAIASRLRERPDGLLTLQGAPRRRRLPPPRLLGVFEPLLMAWADRTPILGDHLDLVTTNGIFKAFAFVAGRTVGTWSVAGNAVAMDLREPVSAAELAALEDDARDVERYLRR